MVPCFRRLAVLLTLSASFAGILSGSSAKALVAVFESRYREAHSLQVTFIERYSENGRVVRVETGTAYFRRPGKMRWEYESPEKNLFLVDGKAAWFYVPADHTVTRVPAKESTDWRTPLALLAGEMKTSRVCAQIGVAVDERPESPDDAVLYCKLRGAGAKSEKSCSPDCTVQREQTAGAVFFEIVKTTGDLVRVLIRDPGGVSIEFHFTNWKTNPYLDDSIFHFTSPPGVAIVNAELPPGNGKLNP
jgi:outer membrane lipoprotein carrier protein